jgi:aryl-alcohol dehydrogenase-like predicted oxidoreductase
MRWKRLSCLDRLVSVVCLGTGHFGSELDHRASFGLLDHFFEAGGTFIDTAHVYGAWDKTGVNGGCGNSEKVIGDWIRDRNCRRQVIIGTKGGHPDFETGVSGMSRSKLLEHLHESLDHLQTDYIDIYWLHRDDRTIPVEDILGWMQEPVEQGIVRALGCSHWRIDRIAEAMKAAEQHGLPAIEISQIAWSLACPVKTITDGPFGEQLAMDEETWEFHHDHNFPVAAYNSQAGGFFGPKYNDFSITDPDFPNPDLASVFGSGLNVLNRQVASDLATKKGCSTNQVALAWLLHQPFPTFAVIGPRNIEQLEDSIGGTDINLDQEEMRLFTGTAWYRWVEGESI